MPIQGKPTAAARFSYLARLLSLTLCLLLSAEALTGAVFGADGSGRKVVRVGWYESAHCYYDSFGRRKGDSYEYQQRIAAYAGWSFEYVEGGWTELLQMLSEGEIDLLGGVSYTPARAETMLFSARSAGTESYFIYVRAGGALDTGDLSSLNGKRVGVSRGSVQADLLRSWARENGLSPKILSLVTSEADMAERLESGKLDAFVSLGSMGAREQAVPICSLGSSDYYFAVSKTRPELLSELDDAMRSIEDEDPFFRARIMNEYAQLIGANAFLSPELEQWLNAHGSIRVGYLDDYLPFCAQDESGKTVTGALRDYLTHAALNLKNADMRFKTTSYPTTEAALDALGRGEVDCVFPVNLSTGDCEAKGLLTSGTVMHAEMYALAAAEGGRRLASGQPMRAALAEGSTGGKTFLMDSFPTWTIVFYPDTDACFRAVSSGAADCLLLNAYRLNEVETQRRRHRLSAIPTGEAVSLSFAVRSDERELYSVLNRVAALADERVMETALISYMRTGQRISFSHFLRDNLLIVSLIAVAVFALIVLLFNQKLRAERRAGESQKRADAEETARQSEQVESLWRELKQQEQLNEAMHIAYTDPLTGVKSKHAYTEAAEELDRRIGEGTAAAFGVVVFDLNDLKKVNDFQGHQAGDAYIKEACRLICSAFQHSPVYRVGGDEFTAVLEGEDYAECDALLERFENQMTENLRQKKIVISSGFSRFEPERDRSFRAVFERADERMYERKKQLKELSGEPSYR
ncbi:MAG: transporter substrate-binding domain-containing protein [Oscillospiraceae bacterium]|nr:transporter substrate-binding domain-containing protein [Oscillospiraceae bacterium]